MFWEENRPKKTKTIIYFIIFVSLFFVDQTFFVAFRNKNSILDLTKVAIQFFYH